MRALFAPKGEATGNSLRLGISAHIRANKPRPYFPNSLLEVDTHEDPCAREAGG